jgi:hypothetical protein
MAQPARQPQADLVAADVDAHLHIYEKMQRIDKTWLVLYCERQRDSEMLLEDLLPRFMNYNDKILATCTLDQYQMREVRRQCGDPLSRKADLVWSFMCTIACSVGGWEIMKVAKWLAATHPENDDAWQQELIDRLLRLWCGPSDKHRRSVAGFWKKLCSDEREMLVKWWRCRAKRIGRLMHHPDQNRLFFDYGKIDLCYAQTNRTLQTGCVYTTSLYGPDANLRRCRDEAIFELGAQLDVDDDKEEWSAECLRKIDEKTAQLYAPYKQKDDLVRDRQTLIDRLVQEALQKSQDRVNLE